MNTPASSGVIVSNNVRSCQNEMIHVVVVVVVVVEPVASVFAMIVRVVHSVRGYTGDIAIQPG